ncbi:MAG: GNAT family N-acetyltransferase [Oscillospiraceae bacterium]|nr:GNAT family N-acetyltransferase [Oscillospiraceae bacterium]
MEKSVNGVLLTTEFTMEDVETSIRRQREIFGGEFGFLDSSHPYAEKAIREFVKTWQAEKDFMLVAKAGDRFVGTITFMGEENGVGRLRFLIVEPDMRGKGLGKAIVTTALEWAKDMGYSHIYLSTHSILNTARRMYSKLGFVKTGEESAEEVCPGAMEEVWEIDV